MTLFSRGFIPVHSFIIILFYPLSLLIAYSKSILCLYISLFS